MHTVVPAKSLAIGIICLMLAMIIIPSSVSDVSADDNFAIMWASKNGHSDIIKIILSNYNDVFYIKNALGWANYNKHPVAAELLSDKLLTIS